jgi:hypothetical protein
MPKKKCGFGFSCAAMMLTPGLDPGDCPNYRACGSATDLTPEEQVELIRVREVQRQQQEAEREQAQQEWERIQEEIRVNRQEAAVMMLMMRGCPQTSESLGVLDPLAEIETQLTTLRLHLQSFEGYYVAPEGCEAHRYNVKRPWGVYEYNKLAAQEPIFEPSEKVQRVKVLHLSRDDDPRNLEGRLGIERRNRLTQIRTQLQIAEAALAQAIALASTPLNAEQVLASQ